MGIPDDNLEDEFAELDRQADSGELTEEKLQQKLNDYAKALAEEYETAMTTVVTPEDAADNTRVFLRNNAPMAAAQIAWLAGNSTSDGVRLSASKYILDHVLEDHNAKGDPVKELLNSLAANGVTPPE